VVRERAIPNPLEAYPTTQAQLIALAPRTGDSYNRDNARVYGLIKHFVLEGPGRSYILRFDAVTDGMNAMLALKAHCEGDSFQKRNIEDAYSILDSLSYEGEKRGFTFEKFVQRQMECYQELEHFNEPVLENKKVRDLLSRIKAPELAAAKQQVKATQNLATNFEEAVNFLPLSVTPIKQSNRSVAAFDATHAGRVRGHGRGGQANNRDGRGSSSRGRDRGRGRRRNYQSHGRGRYTPYTGYYTPEEWQSLSAAQRTGASEACNTSNQSQGGSNNDTRRRIGAIEAGASQDDASAITTPTQLQGTVITTPSNSNTNQPQRGSAGNQFGQRSRFIGAVHTGPRTLASIGLVTSPTFRYTPMM